MDMGSTAMSMASSSMLVAMSTMSSSLPSTTPTDTSMSMSMGSAATATATAAMSSSTADTGAMSMDMGAGSCKIAMTWNWYTIDACFISQTWHITSSGMFAASCIGVIALVVLLEFLRRLGREYDRKLHQGMSQQPIRRVSDDSATSDGHVMSEYANMNKEGTTRSRIIPMHSTSGRVTRTTLLGRQLIRSLLHMATFAVAYFVMLLAMYYNGYIIISILIGAFLGSFIFSWDQLYAKRAEDCDNAAVMMCCG